MSGKESETCRKIVLNRHPLSFADSRAVRKDEYRRTWCETFKDVAEPDLAAVLWCDQTNTRLKLVISILRLSTWHDSDFIFSWDSFCAFDRQLLFVGCFRVYCCKRELGSMYGRHLVDSAGCLAKRWPLPMGSLGRRSSVRETPFPTRETVSASREIRFR